MQYISDVKVVYFYIGLLIIMLFIILF